MISIHLIRSTGYFFLFVSIFVVSSRFFSVFLNFQYVNLSSLWLNLFLSIFLGEGLISVNVISSELFFHAVCR